MPHFFSEKLPLYPKQISFWIPYMFFVLISFLIMGCQKNILMPTPNLYISPDLHPFDEVSAEHRSNEIKLLYATDRLLEEGDGEKFSYSSGRSLSLAFGHCIVRIGKEITWEELIKNNRVNVRDKSLDLQVVSIKEHGRFPATPMPRIASNGRVYQSPETVASFEKANKSFQETIRKSLILANRKELIVFIHGYNNTFEDAAMTLAELWHFLGREHVPMLYSWPAGHEGLLRGYTRDRESGEFTIFHLKQFFRTIAAIPEIDKIHVVGHSRGTDVCASALRELFIEYRGEGRDIRKKLKIGNVVLAAPDLDLEVVTQRYMAERFSDYIDHLTIYVSGMDKAIKASEILHDSSQRIGQMDSKEIEAHIDNAYKTIGLIDIINVKVWSSFIGHGYFLDSPEVSSDLILLLRYNKKAGKQYGRPLIPRGTIYWEIDEGYPFLKQE